jgi:hypothetical protein
LKVRTLQLVKVNQHYGGIYIENLAFNPSLSPFHVALINMLSCRVNEIDEIDKIVLLEDKGNVVKQFDMISNLLKCINNKSLFIIV